MHHKFARRTSSTNEDNAPGSIKYRVSYLLHLIQFIWTTEFIITNDYIYIIMKIWFSCWRIVYKTNELVKPAYIDAERSLISYVNENRVMPFKEIKTTEQDIKKERHKERKKEIQKESKKERNK